VLALHEQFLLGGKAQDLAVDLGELVAELTDFSAQGSYDVAVDRGLTFAGKASQALVDELLSAIGFLVEPFEAGQGVAEVDRALGGEVTFEANDVGIELGQQRP